jgi:hypothetical protein
LLSRLPQIFFGGGLLGGIGALAKGEAGGTPFGLFLSALGFRFSLFGRICPFAMTISSDQAV